MHRRSALFALFVAWSIPLPLIAQGEGVFRDGEELTYAVRWNFIRLGTIVVRAAADPSDTGLLRTSMTVESAAGLPFISIRETNESLIAKRNAKTLRYSGNHRNGERVTVIEYVYEPASRVLSCLQVNPDDGETARRDTLRDVPPFVDGTALFFYSRWRSGTASSYRVPTVVDGKVSNTYLTFSDEEEDVEIDAIRTPVRTRRYWGRADWNGGSSAGMTGNFCGWISDDGAAIPVRAEMEIALGSITVELERWKRPGWMPPGALEASNRPGSGE